MLTRESDNYSTDVFYQRVKAALMRFPQLRRARSEWLLELTHRVCTRWRGFCARGENPDCCHQ